MGLLTGITQTSNDRCHPFKPTKHLTAHQEIELTLNEQKTRPLSATKIIFEAVQLPKIANKMPNKPHINANTQYNPTFFLFKTSFPFMIRIISQK